MTITEQSKEQNVFEKLQLLMDYIEIDSDYISLSSKNEIERMHIKLSKDEKNSFPIVAKVMFLNDIEKSLNRKMADGSDDSRDMLDFYVDLPVIVNEKTVLAFNILIVKFNSLIPVGAFGVNEKNNVYFRYTLVTEKRDVAPTVFVEIIDMISFYIGVLGQEIINFSENKQTLEQSLENGFKNMTGLFQQLK